MSLEVSPDETDTGSVNGDGDNDTRVLLFMKSGRDRELLFDTLSDHYRVETTTDVERLDTTFDCCIFDVPEFNRVAGTVQSKRDNSSPVFLPFVLLVGETSSDATTVELWEYVDDVIELPVKKAGLLSRVKNLIERRQMAVQLAHQQAQLKETVEDLTLKERAMDEAPVGITIAEPGDDDDALIYANEQFERITGYDTGVIGSDCRFLQGEETDSETRATIREALDARDPVSVDILNYRKNGQKFWNKLDIAPLHDSDGGVTHFVGFQTDITDRKIRERRLEVLNRVLSHNLRNKMNIIEGHATLLEQEFDDQPPDSLARIEETASDLAWLAESVQKIDHLLAKSEDSQTVIDLDERMKQLLSAFEDRFPSATFDLSLPSDGSSEVAVKGLISAIEEAIENAVKHNDSENPSVEIRIRRRSEEWIDIEIEDDGPGIPDDEIMALRKGETSLRHGDRLGLWLMYWVVRKAGGRFSVTDADPRGSTVTLSIPVAD